MIAAVVRDTQVRQVRSASPRIRGVSAPSTSGDSLIGGGSAQRGGESAQRARLLEASLQLALQGSRTASVAEVVALAGTSRPTFYELFSDREDCLVSALAAPRRALLAEIEANVASRAPAQATEALAEALITFAERRPALARLLLSDLLAGGSRQLEASDAFLADAASVLERAFEHLAAREQFPDLAPRVLVGALCRLLAFRLERGQPIGESVRGELVEWLHAYDLPAARHRWRALKPLPAPERSPFLAPTILRSPPPMPAGRLPRSAVAEDQWLRIVFATAETVTRDGYSAATVKRITDRAGVDGRAFYRLFPSKQRALSDARELLFRRLIATSAGAFVAGDTWAEHVWELARALTQSLEENPTLSQIAFIESYAGSPAATPQLQEFVRGFTIFLQQGRGQAPGGDRAPAPSPLAEEAIVTGIFELCALRWRRSDGAELPGLVSHVAFLVLAPYMGAGAANRFLDAKLSSRGTPAAEASAATAVSRRWRSRAVALAL